MLSIARHAAHAAAAVSAAEVIGMLALVAAAACFAYWASLRLRPYRDCPRCNGDSFVRGALFTSAKQWCPRCGGKSVVPRAGTYLLARQNRPQEYGTRRWWER